MADPARPSVPERDGGGLAKRLRLTVRHYYDFGRDRALVGPDLVRPEAWDSLRTSTDGPFGIPATREEFVWAAEHHADVGARAQAIDTWLDEQGARSVASYGVGAAALEWWLWKLRPDRPLIVTDYAQATVERLVEVFPEGSPCRHDLRRDTVLPADIHLFHRIDTELTNGEWRDVLRRFGTVRVLVVAADVIGVRRAILELLSRPRMKMRGASRAGFLRNRAAFERLWEATHTARRLRMWDLDAWALTPRRHGRHISSATSAAV